MKSSILRLLSIVIISLTSGIILNQWHPRGIGIKNLFGTFIPGSKHGEAVVHIIPVDSMFSVLDEPGTTILDIRSLDDYQLDHIPGALHVSITDLLKGSGNAFSLPKNYKLIIYDQEGDMTQLKLATQAFGQAGFQQIFWLFGGYVNWLEKGMDIESESRPHE